MSKGIDKDSINAYIAGFFDGEGCIHVVKAKPRRGRKSSHYHLIITFTQKRPHVLRLISRHFGLVEPRYTKSNDARSGLSTFRYDLQVRDELLAETILDAIYPYLIVKGSEARIAKDFLAAKRKHYREQGYKSGRYAKAFDGESYYLAMRSAKNYDEDFGAFGPTKAESSINKEEEFDSQLQLF